MLQQDVKADLLNKHHLGYVLLSKKDHLSQVEEAYYNITPETSVLSKAGFSPKTGLQNLPYR